MSGTETSNKRAMKTAGALLITLWLCTSFSARAESDNTSHMGISVTTGYRFGGSFEDPVTGESLDLDDDASIGLVINVDHDSHTEWEISYSHQETELQAGTLFSGGNFGLDVDYLSAGGIYLWNEQKIQPFIGAALGITHLRPEDSRYDSETRLLLQLSGGYLFFLTPNLGIRVEARGYATLLDTDAAIFCGNGACIAHIESSGFGQFEINAGLSLRF